MDNHEDYRNNVIINEEKINDWESTFITVELLDTIDHVSDSSVEDITRDGFSMNNSDDDDDDAADNDNADANDDIIHDLPFTASGIININNIAEIPDIITLNHLAQLKGDNIVNVIIGSKILNQYDYDIYFISAFPILFPYGIGKHRDPRREDK
jgi:hypothetical protein